MHRTQFANGLNRILHRLRSNRIYAQVIALLVVCIVKFTAVANIVSAVSERCCRFQLTLFFVHFLTIFAVFFAFLPTFAVFFVFFLSIFDGTCCLWATLNAPSYTQIQSLIVILTKQRPFRWMFQIYAMIVIIEIQ